VVLNATLGFCIEVCEIGRPRFNYRFYTVKLYFDEIYCGDVILRHVRTSRRHEDAIDVQQSISRLTALVIPTCFEDGGDRTNNGCQYHSPGINVHWGRLHRAQSVNQEVIS
jgi:hypothetical protein